MKAKVFCDNPNFSIAVAKVYHWCFHCYGSQTLIQGHGRGHQRHPSSTHPHSKPLRGYLYQTVYPRGKERQPPLPCHITVESSHPPHAP